MSETDDNGKTGGRCAQPTGYGLGRYEDRRLEVICSEVGLKPTKKLAQIYDAGIRNGKALEKEIWP